MLTRNFVIVRRHNRQLIACANLLKWDKEKQAVLSVTSYPNGDNNVINQYRLQSTTLFSVIFLFLTTFASFSHASNTVSWLEDYQEAVTQSEQTGKPILALFTGSDWCGWCKKLEKEVFYTPDFAEKAGDAFVFLKVDFPMYTRQPTEQKNQNEELKRQHGVRGFPTVVLLDEKQQKITSTGYQTGGGSKYAEYLLKVLTDYATYQKNQGHATANQSTPQELEDLYQQAKQLGQIDDLDQIITLGSQSNEPSFFLLERYLKLVEEGLAETKEASDVRERLLAEDPENKLANHRRLAVIDFQRLAEDLEVDQTADAWAACKPLLDYIKQWGEQDKDHIWRLQMTVAQTLLNRKHVEEALDYAKNSHEMAPVAMKGTIKEAITEIEKIKIGASNTSIE